MQKEYLDFIPALFLFKDVCEKDMKDIMKVYDFSVKDFSKGDVIFSPDNFQKKIGFVMEGECRVERLREEGSAVFLNTLHRFDSFGIMAALSWESEYPTQIVASKSASILFIDGEDLLEMIKNHSEISMNVISFLTSRIAFLNKKIATFSGKSTLQKLAAYLLAKNKSGGDVVKISRTKIASELGIGRASVYRDLDVLAERHLIQINQKEIIIICHEGLERI